MSDTYKRLRNRVLSTTGCKVNDEAISIILAWYCEQAAHPHNGEQGGEWVRCEYRLPSKIGHYCIALADPDDTGWSTSVTWTAFWNGDDFEDCDPVEDGQPVTHWMPLPQPPQDREGGE